MDAETERDPVMGMAGGSGAMLRADENIAIAMPVNGTHFIIEL